MAKWLTTKEAAEYMQYADSSSVRALIRAGKLPAGRRGASGPWLIRQQDIDAFLMGHGNQADVEARAARVESPDRPSKPRPMPTRARSRSGPAQRGYSREEISRRLRATLKRSEADDERRRPERQPTEQAEREPNDE